MTKQVDINQTSLDLGIQLEKQKTKRIHFLKTTKKTYFSDKQTSLDNLIKLTYDITDKDFEYFYAHILEKQGYTNVIVNWWMNDWWVDIEAHKDGKLYFIQCKQWANGYIDIKKAGEYYATIWERKKQNPDAIFCYVTTSYLHYKVIDFFKGHDIKYMDNIPLIRLCEKMKVFDTDNWNKIRASIYQKRIEKLKKDWFKNNTKEILRQNCLREFRNHLSENIRYKPLLTYSKGNESIISKYFEQMI